MDLEELLRSQRTFFETGETRRVDFRLCALKKLKKALIQREQELFAALKADLNKSHRESYLTEVGIVRSEIDFALSNLRHWAAPRRVPTPLAQFPAHSRILPSPYGCALILAPWNYPLQLALCPLVSALAAGNTAVVKPGEDAPETARVLSELLGEAFPPEYVAVVQGDAETAEELTRLPFDKIFFTGSPYVGRKVMENAAGNLVPVTLELGGKSPCIVEETADIPLAARRIVFGKILNAGQTCVAPDYVLVQNGVKEALLEAIREEITEQLGERPLENEDYGRMVNKKHFLRVCELCVGQKVFCGGRTDPAKLKIEPTVLTGVDPDSPVMAEEIFGPVLPVLGWEDWEEARAILDRNSEPLALYVFTQNRAFRERVLREVAFGGACVNDTVVHLATPHLPFGGVGSSGMGSCHGKAGFDAFTHEKSVLYRGKTDLSMRYQPYTKQKERLVRLFLR